MTGSDDSIAKPPAAAMPPLLPLSLSPLPPSAATDEATTGTAQESESPTTSPSPRRRNRRKSARQVSAESDAEMDAHGTDVTQGELMALPSQVELIALPSPVTLAASHAPGAFTQSDALASTDAHDGQSDSGSEAQAADESIAAGEVPVATSNEATTNEATPTEFDDEQPDADATTTLEEAVQAAKPEQLDVVQVPPPTTIPALEPGVAEVADIASVDPAEPVAASAEEELTDAELIPPVAAVASESELPDIPEVPEDLDELVDEEPVDEEPMDDEDMYSEPGESPSPSPLPSPSRGDPTTNASESSLDDEAVDNGDVLLDMNMQSAEDLRLDASSPFSTSVNGPGCSTAEDMPESPMSNLESPIREDGCEQPNSPNQDTERIDSPRDELESPGSAAPNTSASMSDLQASSPTQSDGAPLSLEAPGSPAVDLGSPPPVGNESMPSPPSKIVAPRSKKTAATNPPPAPTVAKKLTKSVGTRTAAGKPVAASRLPVAKAPAVTKPAPKASNITKTTKSGSEGSSAKTEKPKKTVPAKTATTKKSAPKAVVYNVAPAPRAKRAAPLSERLNERTPSSPTERKAADGSNTAGVASSDQDSAQVHPKRVSKAKSEAASNRLYEDAKAAKLRKEARSAEVDEACTFVPKVSHTNSTTVKRPSLGETDRFVALHEEAKQLQAKKQELQRKHEEETCTFRPTITSKAKKLARETTRPRYENLYMQARELKQRREEKALAKKKEDDSEYSFRPKIKPTKSPVQSKPLYDADREKQKQLLLEQKRKEAELSECTFKPKVLSKKPITKPEAGSTTGEDGKIYDRLYRAGKVQAERIERMRKEREDEEKAKAPFQPRLVTSSSAHKATDVQQKEPFHKRLYKKDHMQKISADREQQKLEEERRFSYKPKISEIPEEIKAKQKEYTSPDKPIFERLYEEKEKIKEKLQASEEMRAQKEMAECTFRPRVASSIASSGGSAPTSPVWERLSICHKSQTLEERERLKQQLELQECTFKPVISASDHISPYRSPSYLSRRHSSRSDSCSPSFDDAARKASVKAPRSSPESRSSLAQFQPVSIGNILKSSTLVLTEEKSPATGSNTTSPPTSVTKSSTQTTEGTFVTLDSPRRPSPVHKPTEVFGERQGRDKNLAVSDNSVTKPQLVARSLDAEFQEMQGDTAVLS